MKWLVWIKDNIIAILAASIAILGAGILWRYHKRRVAEVEDKHIVKIAKGKIKALEEMKTVYKGQEERRKREISMLDEEILANKRTIVEMHEYSEELNDGEVLQEFRNLGYLLPLTSFTELVINLFHGTI